MARFGKPLDSCTEDVLRVRREVQPVLERLPLRSLRVEDDERRTLVARIEADLQAVDAKRRRVTLMGYRLIEQIGEGARGIAWSAVDISLDCQVAITLLPEIVASNA